MREKDEKRAGGRYEGREERKHKGGRGWGVRGFGSRDDGRLIPSGEEGVMGGCGVLPRVSVWPARLRVAR